MRITCLGAARVVTGSCYLVELAGGESFLVDCGMFQGGRRLEERNFDTAPYRAREIKAILITHAHIDHSGLVPRLVREGFQGPVYATRATCDLLDILWQDAAHIQESEAAWQTRKNRRTGGEEVQPLYEAKDALAASRLLKPVDLGCYPELLPGVQVCFVTAGHILGAASLMLNVKDAEGQACVGFSGDVGRPGQLIVPDPARIPPPGTLFMETTYGNRLHKSLAESQRELVAVINQAYRQGGKVLIPAFAVERTQELIYTLSLAFRRGELPADLPVFLDSPLAIKATEVFRRHPEFFDRETADLVNGGQNPLDFPSLRFTPSTVESQKINEYRGPAVIMAGNGMASAGRIKHHLKHNLWRDNAHVVIVGFQGQGSLGRQLVEGKKVVTIFGEPVAVRAQVHTIGGFSAHADQQELLAWLAPLARPGVVVNLMHGEEANARAFMAVAQERFPQMVFHLPEWREMLLITPWRAAATPARPRRRAAAPVDPAALTRELRERLFGLADRLGRAGGSLPPAELKKLARRLASLEKALPGAEAD